MGKGTDSQSGARGEIERIHAQFPPEESPEGLGHALLDLLLLGCLRNGFAREERGFFGAVEQVGLWIGFGPPSESSGSWLSNPHLIWSYKGSKSAGSFDPFSASHSLHDSAGPAIHALIGAPVWRSPAGSKELWIEALRTLRERGWLLEAPRFPGAEREMLSGHPFWRASAAFRPMERSEALLRHPRSADLLRAVIRAAERIGKAGGAWGGASDPFQGNMLESVKDLLRRSDQEKEAKELGAGIALPRGISKARGI